MSNSKQKLTRIRVARGQPAGAALLTVAALVTATPWARDAGAPQTERRDVNDSYFNVTVTDPYRWLEAASDPRVKTWSASQDQRTRHYLDGLAARQPIYDRLNAQISASSPSYYELQVAGGRLFAFFNQPPKQQPMLTNARSSSTSWGSRSRCAVMQARQSLPHTRPPGGGSRSATRRSRR
jgi:hypothetical protein